MGEKMSKNLKYMVVYNYFLGLIKSDALKPGDRLPTESEIEEQFHVSRITVVNALNKLEKDHFIKRVQGSGSFVMEKDFQTEDVMKLVALVISFKGQGREINLIESIEDQFSRSGYSLLIKNSNNDPENERQIIENLKHTVSGIILYPASPLETMPLHRELFREQYPIVYLDRYPLSVPSSYVVSDNYSGGYEIGKYLVENGCEQFILIFHDTMFLTSERDRIDGFMRAMSESNVSKNNIAILESGLKGIPEINNACDRLEESLRKGHKTAIFTCNDTFAYRIMNVIKDRELDRLDLFIIAGFDDLDSEPVTLPFVTIRQDYAIIGKQASMLLLRKIEDNNFSDEHQIIPVRLITRSSLRKTDRKYNS